eukprot:5365355-Pleurochrysis_carterae.AAC.2
MLCMHNAANHADKSSAMILSGSLVSVSLAHSQRARNAERTWGARIPRLLEARWRAASALSAFPQSSPRPYIWPLHVRMISLPDADSSLLRSFLSSHSRSPASELDKPMAPHTKSTWHLSIIRGHARSSRSERIHSRLQVL